MKMQRLFAVAAVSVAALAATNAYASNFFKSPSGNIICGELEYGSVTCDIIERNNAKPARPWPNSCDLDWGNRFTVDRRRAYMDCYSDWPYPEPAYIAVLSYGQTKYGNGWSCTSQSTGMTCKNGSGRGFTLRRATQQLF